MSLHTWRRQGPREPSSCSTFMHSHRGRAAAGKRRLAPTHAGPLQSCPVLCNPVDCGLQASLSGGSPGKNTGADWPVPVAIPSGALYILLPRPPTPLRTWCGQNPCDPSSCPTSPPGPHRGGPKSPRATSGANPSGPPTCRGGDKTKTETQGQCG